MLNGKLFCLCVQCAPCWGCWAFPGRFYYFHFQFSPFYCTLYLHQYHARPYLLCTRRESNKSTTTNTLNVDYTCTRIQKKILLQPQQTYKAHEAAALRASHTSYVYSRQQWWSIKVKTRFINFFMTPKLKCQVKPFLPAITHWRIKRQIWVDTCVRIVGDT